LRPTLPYDEVCEWEKQEGVSERARRRRRRREQHATGGLGTKGQYNGSRISGQSRMAPTFLDDRISESARENQRELIHMLLSCHRILIRAEWSGAYMSRPRPAREKTA